MTIRQKLLLNSLLMLAGFTTIVALGYLTIHNFQANMHELTTRSTPLQVKMLQFQQAVERLSGDLLQAGQFDRTPATIGVCRA